MGDKSCVAVAFPAVFSGDDAYLQRRGKPLLNVSPPEWLTGGLAFAGAIYPTRPTEN
jgi:hypothetical protein